MVGCCHWHFLPAVFTVELLGCFAEECRTREVILHDRYLLQVVHEAAVAGHTAVVDDMMGRLRKTTGYNQECYNAVLRLVNAGQDDVAFQILLTMKPAVQPEGRVTYAMPGSFFIRQVPVRSKKILKPLQCFTACCRLPGVHDMRSRLHSGSPIGRDEVGPAVFKLTKLLLAKRVFLYYLN